ncbi:MAG: glycosyltransferase involved in cell wall biosynthesis [Sphingobacteriales bacterium]|jgi:glycosyltransferase involved in cell wall biosynthesis
METKLSVVIITFNEEKNIGRCLESVKGLADEILVVDSFSTDKTKEICLSKGARFITHPFEDFTKQKNYAFSQASHDWILSLDADEALETVLKRNILELKKSPQPYAFKMHRVTQFCGKWIRKGEWYPDVKLRLVNRMESKFTGGKVHEQLTTTQKVKLLNGEILHYSFYTIDDYVLQNNKFSTLSAQTMHESGKSTTILRVIVAPIFSFVKNYFFKGGFLEGYFGWVIAVNSAHGNFLKYAKLYTLNKLKKNNDNDNL